MSQPEYKALSWILGFIFTFRVCVFAVSIPPTLLPHPLTPQSPHSPLHSSPSAHQHTQQHSTAFFFRSRWDQLQIRQVLFLFGCCGVRYNLISAILIYFLASNPAGLCFGGGLPDVTPGNRVRYTPPTVRLPSYSSTRYTATSTVLQVVR